MREQLFMRHWESEWPGVVPSSAPCQIITPLVWVGLGLGVGEGLGLGVGLGLCNHIEISTRGVIIWQGVENGHNTASPSVIYCNLNRTSCTIQTSHRSETLDSDWSLLSFCAVICVSKTIIDGCLNDFHVAGITTHYLYMIKSLFNSGGIILHNPRNKGTKAVTFQTVHFYTY